MCVLLARVNLAQAHKRCFHLVSTTVVPPYRDGREVRRTVDLSAKHERTAPSACQTHNRVQLWEPGGRRACVLGCSVAQQGGHVVQKSYQNGFYMARSSTENNLSRDLELDRPSALWISVPEAPGSGPRLSNVSGAVDENRHRRLPTQTCVSAVIRHAMATPWVCEVYVDNLENSFGSVLTPLL